MRADPRASVAAICSRARSLRTGWLLKAVSSGGWLIISRWVVASSPCNSLCINTVTGA